MSTLAEIEEAQQETAAQDLHELAHQVQELLGQKLVAYALGDRHPKTVGRYARGERDPEPEAWRRLIDLGVVVEILRRGMGERTIKSWMLGSNPRLGGRSPIEELHAGNAHQVMGAASAFVSDR